MTVDTVSTSLITVGYGNSLQAMIAAGKYDWVNSGITAKRFPVEAPARLAHVAARHFERGPLLLGRTSPASRWEWICPWIGSRQCVRNGESLQPISVAGIDPGVSVPNDAGVRVAVVAQAQPETCERQTPAPAAPAPTKATTTEAGHANRPAEAGADDPYATEATSPNRTPSEAADRSASEAAATDAAAKAGADRSTTETTTTYRPAPKAAAHPAAPGSRRPSRRPGSRRPSRHRGSHRRPHRRAFLHHRAGLKPRREG